MKTVLAKRYSKYSQQIPGKEYGGKITQAKKENIQKPLQRTTNQRKVTDSRGQTQYICIVEKGGE